MSPGRVQLVAALLLGLLTWPAGADEKAAPTTAKGLYDLHCETCHGATGKGDGDQAIYISPQPQDFTTGLLDKRTDAFLASVISKGGLANGLADSMPAFPKLSKADVQALVAYVRQLGKGAAQKPK